MLLNLKCFFFSVISVECCDELFFQRPTLFLKSFKGILFSGTDNRYKYGGITDSAFKLDDVLTLHGKHRKVVGTRNHGVNVVSFKWF